MSNPGIAEKVRSAIEETVCARGCTIWDVEYVKEGARKVLRVTIDSDEGIDLDKCEEVHRAIDPIIDEIDPIEDFYYLECSSPGLERVLRKPEHFAYALGKKIDVKLFTALNGTKEMTGVLDLLSDDGTKVVISGTEVPFSMISRANMHFDFDE